MIDILLVEEMFRLNKELQKIRNFLLKINVVHV